MGNRKYHFGLILAACFVLIAFANPLYKNANASSLFDTEEEKATRQDCEEKILTDHGFKNCKEYANRTVLKEYGIAKGKDCSDYEAKIAKKVESKHTGNDRKNTKKGADSDIRAALKECKKRVSEKTKECKQKIEKCFNENRVRDFDFDKGVEER